MKRKYGEQRLINKFLNGLRILGRAEGGELQALAKPGKVWQNV